MSKENYSRAIDNLRFPLIVAVVLIHCNICDYSVTAGHLYGYQWFRLIGISLIAKVAVPAFFFISGYLLYANGGFTWTNYKLKLHTRAKSLLVPYLSWNTICFLLVLTLQLLKPDFRLLLHKSVADMQLKDFFLIYWDLGQLENLTEGRPGPILGPMWFIKELMILVVFSPLLRYPLKYLKWCWPMFLAFLCLTPLPYRQSIIQDPTSVLFFTLGLAFSNSRIILDKLERHRISLSLLTLFSMVLIVLAVVTPLFDWMSPQERSVFMNVAILIEQFAFMMASFALVAKRAPVKHELSESSFFIFCMHPFVSSVFMNIAKFDLSIFHSSVLSILFVLLSVVVTIAVCLLTFHIMRRYFPRLMLWLTGNRC